MYKNISPDIKRIYLDQSLHQIHKKNVVNSKFGMDDTPELLDGGFGLYSTIDLKGNIEPIKTEYFRISLTRQGNVCFNIGLEKHHPVRNTIVFGIPGQIFSLSNPSEDFLAYYMLFSEKFIGDIFFQHNSRQQFPFLTYQGFQCFNLSEETAAEIDNIYHKINAEIKSRKSKCSDAIRLYIQLILIYASRDYEKMIFQHQNTSHSAVALYNNFIKLVSQHFLTIRKVADYAVMLHVSADHLNRTIKSQSDKTAGEFIQEMLMLEAKAYLIHTKMSISEIAYQLDFSDPSHFNRFFKKLTAQTPVQFRNQFS
ncbi:MAG: AraC family transcriptional regulator [Sphingobacteriales bacterium]|nr:MAG: AraC family transcriptional regulator [Sphingobacteriales bacterium]